MEPADDHRAFLAALPDETRRSLHQKSDAPGLARLALHAGLIVIVGALIAAGPPGWPLLLPVQGVLIAFLFTLQHECTHKTPFRTPSLNEWTGRLTGALIFQPFEWFRYFHLAHHRWTNDPDRDPELAGGGKPETWAAYLIHVSGWPYWRGNAGVLLRSAFGDPGAGHTPRRAAPRVKAEARIMLAVYVAAALFTALISSVLIFVWILPLALGMPALRLYLLAEHGRCPAAASMFENTRTTLTVQLVRFLAWNMPYHAEHHAAPNVPFHRLPDLHALARGRLKMVQNGYGAFTATYAAGLRGWRRRGVRPR